jgi:hypothetical protein
MGVWEMSVETGGHTIAGARAVFEWLEDGAFAVQRAYPGPPTPDMPAVWIENSPLPTKLIIGLDDTAESFTGTLSDDGKIITAPLGRLDRRQRLGARLPPHLHEDRLARR